MALICNTGPLLAALDLADVDHHACARPMVDATEDLGRAWPGAGRAGLLVHATLAGQRLAHIDALMILP